MYCEELQSMYWRAPFVGLVCLGRHDLADAGQACWYTRARAQL